MATIGMADRVPTQPRCPALQLGELRDHALIVQELHSGAIEQWQKFRVDDVADLVADFVGNAVRPKPLRRPFTRIIVPMTEPIP